MAAPDEIVGISAAPARTLEECEEVIERGLDTFVEVGQALFEIRQGGLYRETYGTFDAYCRERWGWRARRAEQLMEASKVAAILSDGEAQNFAPPKNDAQARELGRLRGDPEAVREVWAEVTEATGGKPTASNVREFVNKRLGEERPAQVGGPGWKPSQVLEAQEHLDALPVQERPKAVALVSQPGTPPHLAVEMIRNLAAKPLEIRSRIFANAGSPDPRDRSLALTEAAERPPMPDPRLRLLDRAVGEYAAAVRMFPDDAMTPRIQAWLDGAKAHVCELEEYRRA